MSEGYVRLYRQTLDSEVFKDAGVFHLFAALLLIATRNPIELTRKNGRGVVRVRLEPGESIVSERELAATLHAGRNQIHKRMEALVKLGCVTTRTDGNVTIATVLNWTTFQPKPIGGSEMEPLKPIGGSDSGSEMGPPIEKYNLINKKKQKARVVFDPAEIELPSELGEAFRETWREWCSWRRDEHKKPITPSAARLQLKQLASWGLAGAIASVEQSIRNEWRGLFPVTSPAGNKSAPTPPTDPRPCGPSGRVARF